jgi:hypothetical protein
MFTIKYDPRDNDCDTAPIYGCGITRREAVISLLENIPETCAPSTGFYPALEVAFCNIDVTIKFWSDAQNVTLLVTHE